MESVISVIEVHLKASLQSSLRLLGRFGVNSLNFDRTLSKTPLKLSKITDLLVFFVFKNEYNQKEN